MLQFTPKLMSWNTSENQRIMPWKGEKDPYKIWLSEIILQQTRVEQGLEYYNNFVNTFPTIHDLANAPDEQVFKMWEGLGYYSRCKNLIATARKVSVEYNGKFPDNYLDIIKLKGIGPYTAAAIASFAFNEPRAVVDGNVLRVLSRYFGISLPIDSTEGKKIYQTLAESLIDKSQPAAYNQAIMDFGATVCKPQLPLCDQCVQQADCQAFALNAVRSLPVKEKKLVKKTRYFNYFIVTAGTSVLVRKRTGKDIWENLYEFMLIEGEGPEHSAEAVQKLQVQQPSVNYNHQWTSKVYKQALTHITVYAQFHILEVQNPTPPEGNYEWVPRHLLQKYPWPKLIQEFLQEKQSLAQLF